MLVFLYSRQHRPPSKDLLRLFIRTNALHSREGSTSFTPWIVNDIYCRKYSLQSKFPDLLVSPDKLRDLGAKALEESLKTIKLKKKRKSTEVDKKKSKKQKLDPKQKTLDLSKSKASTLTPTKASTSAQKKSPKKSKEIIEDSDSSDSDDSDICLARLKKSPAKPKITKNISDNISLAELKRRLSTAQMQKDAAKKTKKQKKEKNDEGGQNGGDTMKKTPKKVNGEDAAQGLESAAAVDTSSQKKVTLWNNYDEAQCTCF